MFKYILRVRIAAGGCWRAFGLGGAGRYFVIAKTTHTNVTYPKCAVVSTWLKGDQSIKHYKRIYVLASGFLPREKTQKVIFRF